LVVPFHRPVQFHLSLSPFSSNLDYRLMHQQLFADNDCRGRGMQLQVDLFP
jgi:hypothetical protein